MSTIPAKSVEDIDKEKRAQANIEATAEAHRLAAQARAGEGNQPPLVQILAGSIRSKLEQLPPLKEDEKPQAPQA